MKIKLLPDAPTEHRCDACQQMFPAGTLVDDRGRFVCQKCYDTMNPPDGPLDESLLCKEAMLAFKLAIWGFANLGLCMVLVGLPYLISAVLFVIAIFKAVKARRILKDRPELKGLVLANAALVMSVLLLVAVFILFMYQKTLLSIIFGG
ncbi:MAG: hypothetical protein ACYC1M_16850 [Armatimonadota bacterium]